MIRFAAILLVSLAALPARADYPGTGAVKSLADLSPAAASFCDGRSGTVAVAVYDDRTGTTYRRNGAWEVRTASIIKVGILAAILDRAQRAGRALTAWEKDRIHPMITQSDNGATTELWNNVGGANVIRYLQSLGMTDTTPDPGSPNSWGYVRTTARDYLKLVAKIQYGRLWSRAKHDYALDEMRGVISWQAFLRAGLPAGTDIAEKGGWYPEYDSGWYRVHSVGAVSADGRTYTVVILTRYPVSLGFDYGTATIAGVAARIHDAVLYGATTMDPAVLQVNGTGTVNVRTGPGTGYDLLGTVAGGQSYVASARSGGWWKIYYDQRTGWIYGGSVTKRAGVTSVVVNVDLLNVRTGPGSSYAIAGQVVRGMEYAWTRSGVNGFYEVWWRGAKFYLHGDYVVRRAY